MVVVYGCSGSIEHDADEAAEGSLPLELFGVDDVNSGIRAVTQVILRALRIDPADVERPKRIAGDEDARDAFGLRGGWGPGAGARTCHGLVGCEEAEQAARDSQVGGAAQGSYGSLTSNWHNDSSLFC